MDLFQNHIEALIFCAPDPIGVEDLVSCLEEMYETTVKTDDVLAAVGALQEKYNNPDFSYEIVELSGGYQFLTKPEYQVSISLYLKQKSKKKLSTSALETLAIIAYKQPITKSDIEQIRGVNCDYAVQKLLEKELVEIRGKSNGIGKPILYGTSDKFMEYFGINSLEELPVPKDFIIKENEIGETNEA